MKKRHKHFKPSAFTTVIGNGTLVKGDIAFSQGLHLDGEIHGNVLGQGKGVVEFTKEQQAVV